MERVDSLGEPSPFLIPDKKKAQKKGKTSRKSFSQLVESAEEGNLRSGDFSSSDTQRGIEELLDGVFEAGALLKVLPTIERIRDYRQTVGAFVKYVIDHMLSVQEATSGTSILKRKRFTIVTVIDRKLEDLARSVLSTQKEQIAILAQVDEINGLLVDLVS